MKEALLANRIGVKVQAVNDKLGVPVKLPQVTVKQQLTNSMLSGALGAAIGIAGTILASKATAIFGAAVVGANMLTYKEAKKVQQEGKK